MNLESQKFEKPTEEKVNENSGKVMPMVVEFAKVILWALVIIIPVRTFLFQPFFVQGASMEPNFHDGEYLIVNELGYKTTQVGFGDKDLFEVRPFKDLARGDVIVFRYPKKPSQFFIKRIVGLPGEKVMIKDDSVLVYNQDHPEGLELDESDYIPTISETKGDITYNLAENEYLVLGDNREHSSDSRTWGTLPEDMIIGKVLLRAWPIEDFKIF